MADHYYGALVTVWTHEFASETTLGAAIGVSTLQVEDADELDPEGGILSILLEVDDLDTDTDPEPVQVLFESANEETVYLQDPLAFAVPARSSVQQWDANSGAVVSEMRALVEAGDDDQLEAVVTQSLVSQIPEGDRQEGQGESVRVERATPAAPWVVMDVYGVQPTTDLSYADPGSIPERAPVIPPAASPTLTVTGFPTWFLVVADGIDPTSTIDYHMSAEGGFIAGPTTLLDSTRAGVLRVTTLPNGDPLVPGATYYFEAIAFNVAGQGPIGVESEGSLRLVELGDETTGELAVERISTGDLTASVAVLGELLFGSAMKLSAEGLIVNHPDGTTSQVPSDGSGPSWRGSSVLDALTILGSIDMRGTAMRLSGALKAMTGVGNPTQPPIVSSEYTSKRLVQPKGPHTYGLCDNPAGDAWFTCETENFFGWFGRLGTWDKASGDYSWILQLEGMGTPTGASNSKWAPVGGVTRIGNYMYVLACPVVNNAPVITSNAWKVFKYDYTNQFTPDPSGNPYVNAMHLVTSWTVPGLTPTHIPAIGNDGTNILTAHSNDGGLYVRTLNENTGVKIDTLTRSTSFPAVDLNSVHRTSDGFSGMRSVLTAMGGTGVYVYDGDVRKDPTAAGGEGWRLAAAGIRGMHKNPGGTLGGVWQTYHRSRVYEYTWNQGPLTVAYAWRDSNPAGAGTAETEATAIREVADPTKFARWRISLVAEPPFDGTVDGANTAALYATSGGQLYLQTILVPPNLSYVIDGLITSGAVPQTISGFKFRPGNLGSISSTKEDERGPIWKFTGDGSFRLDGTNPPGTVIDFAGATPPPGYVLCDGASLLTTKYPDLFAAIGYTHGGSGTSFKVPDMRNRAAVGVGSNRGLGNNDGDSEADRTPAHSHYAGDMSTDSFAYARDTLSPSNGSHPRIWNSNGAHSHNVVGLGNASSGWAGNAGASSNFPHLTLNKLIYAGRILS